jgi:hypothetical protein
VPPLLVVVAVVLPLLLPLPAAFALICLSSSTSVRSLV